MINNDYELFLSDKSFFRKITTLKDNTGGKITIIKKTYNGNNNIPSSFIEAVEAFQNFKIEVKEYGQEYAQHLRVLHKYTKTDFFNSLSPTFNQDNLALFFEKATEKSRYNEFATSNKRFIIKQITRETKSNLLKKFLIPYHKHILHNNSFISQLLGIFSIRVK